MVIRNTLYEQGSKDEKVLEVEWRLIAIGGVVHLQARNKYDDFWFRVACIDTSGEMELCHGISGLNVKLSRIDDMVYIALKERT